MIDVVTDLQTRRVVILGMDYIGTYQVMKAKTPLAELDKYSTSLRSITQESGSYSGKFALYASLKPRKNREKNIKRRKFLELKKK